MSLTREQMREQMIDYLYGELDGEALARFEEALRESEPSRRELAELQATLRAARVELAHDTRVQPPARVRDAVLEAAHAQLAAARAAHDADARRSLPQEARGAPPTAAATHVLRWLRSVWVLPSLVAAAAAALLVFRQEQQTLSPEGPRASSSLEVVPTPSPSSAAALPGTSEANTAPPSSAAELPGSSEANTTAPASSAAKLPGSSEAPSPAAEDSSSGVAAPQREAPARAARKARSARGSGGNRFAAPPADWQRSASADTETRAPAPAPATSARSRDEPALGAAELGAAERREGAAFQAQEASGERPSARAARREAAAPAAAAPSSNPSAQRPSAAADTAQPTPLTAARLEQRAREHAAATRWSQAAADYRELLQRFPQDPRRKLWTEQLELVLHAAAQPVPND